jgi:hypothetical protein
VGTIEYLLLKAVTERMIDTSAALSADFQLQSRR